MHTPDRLAVRPVLPRLVVIARSFRAQYRGQAQYRYTPPTDGRDGCSTDTTAIEPTSGAFGHYLDVALVGAAGGCLYYTIRAPASLPAWPASVVRSIKSVGTSTTNSWLDRSTDRTVPSRSEIVPSSTNGSVSERSSMVMMSLQSTLTAVAEHAMHAPPHPRALCPRSTGRYAQFPVRKERTPARMPRSRTRHSSYRRASIQSGSELTAASIVWLSDGTDLSALMGAVGSSRLEFWPLSRGRSSRNAMLVGWRASQLAQRTDESDAL
jgi:hypothetical protein